MEIRIRKQTFWKVAFIILLGVIGFLLIRVYSLENPNSPFVSALFASNTNSLWAIFLTGLLTGGLTCMAVQGGLLAATIAQREEERLKHHAGKSGEALPIFSFLIAKLIAYTAFGFLLGWFGSLFQLSLSTSVFLQFVIAIFMIGTALNILEVHPIFRYFVIQPPKFLTRIVRKKSKSGDMFAPAMLGAFTVFIPCGTTQAMMALAIASGKPLMGAAILFSFILGTSPLFFVLGYFATKLGDTLHQQFMRFAAFAIIILALFNLNNALALSGRPIQLSFLTDFWCAVAICDTSGNNTTAQNAVSQATITMDNYEGYTPKNITVKAGSNVILHVKNTNGSGCIQGFTIPTFGIQKVIPKGSESDISFTAPTQPQQIAFMCSMGMYRGVIDVI